MADSATSPSESLSRDTLRLGLGGDDGSGDQPLPNKNNLKLGLESSSKDPQMVARENLRLGLEAGGGALPGPTDLALNQSRGLLQVNLKVCSSCEKLTKPDPSPIPP